MSIRSGALLLVLTLPAAAAPPPEPVPDALLQGLSWRLVGPFRAGWGTVGQGIADRPNEYYFGGAGGGVWYSADAGKTWEPRSEGIGTGPIGGLAVAPSNPKVIYAGTGQVQARWDIPAGDGVYRSDDGGLRWRKVGLESTRHIGAIAVDPRDAETVLVAALGHVFGPNPERGVFRSSDGGKTWTRTLFVNNDTGAVDLAMDPVDPNIVFAATWQARNYPWLSYFTPMHGVGSGVHRSLDGGKTWERVAGGFPGGKHGRIGVAAAHTAQGTRVYAAVDSSETGAAGLWRSDDTGATWRRVNDDASLGSGYFGRVTAAPNDPDTVYAMGRSLRESKDGGATFEIIKGSPGGDDYHHLWINPKHTDHWITAADQGTVVTVNGGASWSSWYNQPTGQFYHLATDNRFPYRIYSGQQDNGSVGILSRGDYGSITFRDWSPVGADERDMDIPDAQDPDIVYGSGLGGRLSRWDRRTGEVQNITPWPISSYGERPTDFKHRYSWITPIAVSQKAPYPIYFGSQVLFRSTDQGRRWEAVSGDLSGKKAGAKNCAGDLAPPAARDCGYGVIWAIELAPRDNEEIWVGTDDGNVQLTRDGGKSWRNVTPKALPPWAMVSSVDVYEGAPGTAYLAVDNHRQDDFRPRVFVTHDWGATWREGNAGLPANHVVSVVRSDPARAGLLYAGTEIGVYVSFDDGEAWQPLRRNLPVAWVRDLEVKGDDLIAATQGRAIWVLGGLAPLREMTPDWAADDKAGRKRADPFWRGSGERLFKPGVAVRVRENQNKDTPLPPEEPVGRNPPTGVLIDYWLAADAPGAVTLEIRDARGKVVRKYSSADAPMKLKSDRYFAASWLEPPQALSAKAGMHRFVWDLRHPRPRAPQYEYSIAAVKGVDTTLLPAGPLALPGEYEAVLAANGREHRARFDLRMDPRVAVPRADMEASLALSLEIAPVLDRCAQALGEAQAVRKQLEALAKPKEGATPAPDALRKQAEALDRLIAPILSGDGDANTNLAGIGNVVLGVASDVEGTDRAPTQAQREVLSASVARLQKAEALWRSAKSKELVALNGALKSAQLAEIKVPAAAEIDAVAAQEGKDLP